MAAPKGNKYWMLAQGFAKGNTKKFTPEEMQSKILEYFEWVDENPLMEAVIQKKKVDRDHEEIELYPVPKMRPYTIQGLCIYLGISLVTWGVYKKRKAYTNIITHAENIIYNQKFEGAASGFFNPNIIARDLGLKDKSEQTIIEQPLFNMDGEETNEDE